MRPTYMHLLSFRELLPRQSQCV